MTDPMEATGSTTPKAPDVHQAAPFTDWVQEVRQDRTAPALPSPSFMQRHRRAVRIAIVLFAGIVVAVSTHYLSYRPTGHVTGTLQDPWHRPVAGARVFVASRPSIHTTSNRTGDFVLRNVPVGEQNLIAVLEDRGEEYPVTIQRDETTQLGTLAYRVPPLRFRMIHGDGIEWNGKD